jgi:hypothetical protein
MLRMEDTALLQAYARTASEPAFAALVERHISPLIFSIAKLFFRFTRGRQLQLKSPHDIIQLAQQTEPLGRHPARQQADSADNQTGIHGFHGGARAGLLEQIWAKEFFVFLRFGVVHHARRNLAGKPLARQHGRSGHFASAIDSLVR